jgi:hypothetical protein
MNRWVLFNAMSTRWPSVSLRVHFPGMMALFGGAVGDRAHICDANNRDGIGPDRASNRSVVEIPGVCRLHRLVLRVPLTWWRFKERGGEQLLHRDERRSKKIIDSGLGETIPLVQTDRAFEERRGAQCDSGAF